MRKKFAYISFVLCLHFSCILTFAQESIFTGLKTDLKRAEDYYGASAFLDAAELYSKIVARKDADSSFYLKIADCYYSSNMMERAASAYSSYVQKGGMLDDEDLLRYATALQSLSDYEQAIAVFQNYLEQNLGDNEIRMRVWQLQNIKFLYSDSIYYSVKRLPSNTDFDEICPVIYRNSLVFASNRTSTKALHRKDANNKHFFRWEKADFIRTDSTRQIEYKAITTFGKEIEAKYHKGSIHFNTGGDTAVFVRTVQWSKKSSASTTQIFFAANHDDKWREFAQFPFNSESYAVNNPVFGSNTKTLYFSSDMPGGFGGHDLYKTEWVGGQWSPPQNLGEEINTSQDEKYPYFQDNILYISSNGHPGFGGFDQFTVDLAKKPLSVENMGYPINTCHDDFGLSLDASGKYGFMVSNRNPGVVNDDIYEVIISKISFPLTVKGKIRFRDDSQPATANDLIVLDNAKLQLIDNENQRIIGETFSDQEGAFSLEIPYQAQYKLHVSKDNFGKAVVSMDISRNPSDYLKFEIIIVKDLFVPDSDSGESKSSLSGEVN